MTNFNSSVFSRSIWKATYNAEIRIEHFCQDVFQVLKSLYSLTFPELQSSEARLKLDSSGCITECNQVSQLTNNYRKKF